MVSSPKGGGDGLRETGQVGYNEVSDLRPQVFGVPNLMVVDMLSPQLCARDDDRHATQSPNLRQCPRPGVRDNDICALDQLEQFTMGDQAKRPGVPRQRPERGGLDDDVILYRPGLYKSVELVDERIHRRAVGPKSREDHSSGPTTWPRG